MTASSPIAVARIAAGLKQEQLAERVGISQGQLSRIEHGSHEPAVGVALAIADELGLDVRALWKRSVPQPRPQHRPTAARSSQRKPARGGKNERKSRE